MKRAAILGLVFSVVLASRSARADGDHPEAGPAVDGDHPAPQAIGCADKANTYCVVPAAAVGWQLNLKTGEKANGVGLLGLALTHTFGSLPLGIGIYGGLGTSTAAQSSYQGCIGVSITSWGLVCGGVQRAAFSDGGRAWQGMLTLAGQLTYGGSPSFVAALSKRAGP